MKTSRFASLALAAFLHFAPFLARTVPALPSLAGSPAGILFKWVLGALVIGGSMHTVSAATARLVSASSVSGQTGTRLSYQIKINDGQNRLPGSWVINGVTYGRTGSTTNGMPPGLSISFSTAIISGTPTKSGIFSTSMTAYEDPNRGGARLTFTLTFNLAGTAAPPAISTPPAGGTVTEGDPFTFTVAATGDAPLTYQWYHDDVAVSGATDAVLSLTPVALADAGAYKVTVSNGAGSATSSPVQLVVNPALVAPGITVQPGDLTLHAGEALTLGITATGSAPLSYLWKRDGSPIPGAADNPVFNLAAVTANDAGSYTVEVSGPGGKTTSVPMQINVVPLSIGTVSASGAAVRFALPTIPGRHYLLEATAALGSGSWNSVREFTATGNSTDLTELVSSTPALFWRCAVQP